MYQFRTMQYLASWLFFGLCISWIGCQTNNHDYQANSRIAPRCQLCPNIKSNQDTLEFINEVRRFVAMKADFGNLVNPFCENYSTHLEKFGIDTFLRLFELDVAKATCGLNAMIMVKILLENGIDAYTYNFGWKGTSVTHVIVLAKHHDQLLIFDPYLNYTLLHADGTNMDIVSLIEMVGSNNLIFRTTLDTVIADLIIDEETFNNNHALRDSVMSIPSCVKLLNSASIAGENIKKVKLQRCFECEKSRDCFNMIHGFETRLKNETYLNSYHEAIVLKIGNVWGAPDYRYVDDLIESRIYSQSNLGFRVNKFNWHSIPSKAK